MQQYTVPNQSRSRQVAVTVSLMPDTVDTVIGGPDDGWGCHPKHVEQFADINKPYIVASCWIIIDTYYAMEKISWTDHVRNEEVLLRVNE